MYSSRQLFLQHIAQTSPAPLSLEIESAEGVYLIDAQGKKYIDLISGIGVSVLGHRHPAVLKAIENQIAKYLHTMVYGEYVLQPQIQLAQLLAKQLASSLNSIYFVNSGAEATEGALKLAKRYTGRSKIIASTNAYHGSTHGALSLMSDPYFSRAFRPLLPDVHHLEYNNEAHLDKIDSKTACVILETIQAECGIQLPNDDYLKKMKSRCNEVGALLILDEIQASYGRSGSLFAHQRFDVVPDILLLAKGFGGGMPLGAFIANKSIMETLSHNPVLGHITTFGGHPVSCVAALATLQTLVDEPKWINEVGTKEALFLSNLRHQKIKEIRSAGLWMAVELENPQQVQSVIQYCIKLGLITDWFLFNDRSLRIAPPLTIQENEIITACNIIIEALDQL